MAGSWNHIVKREDKKLLVNEDAVKMLENGGDWYEFAEQVYGMVWFLAMQLSGFDRNAAKDWIEEANEQYKRGLNLSPGINGHLNPGYKEKPEWEDYSGQ